MKDISRFPAFLPLRISLVAVRRKNLGMIWESTNTFCSLPNAHRLLVLADTADDVISLAFHLDAPANTDRPASLNPT
jgi:hypothetical protein